MESVSIYLPVKEKAHQLALDYLSKNTQDISKDEYFLRYKELVEFFLSKLEDNKMF